VKWKGSDAGKIIGRKLLGACGRSSPTFSLALEIDEEGIAIRSHV
jgi:hypothetical protein